jgi:hypothetical protein
MNLCSHYSFLSSFYTCEDAAVQEEDVAVRPWGRLAPTVAAVAGAAVVPDSLSSGHIYLYCNKWQTQIGAVLLDMKNAGATQTAPKFTTQERKANLFVGDS